MSLTNLFFTMLIFVSLLFGGCVTPPKQEELVPESLPVSVQETGKSIKVDPVIVTHVPKPSFVEAKWKHLEPDTFKKAIVDTLNLSGLFSQVNISGPADYQLSADVVGQELLGTSSNIILLLVHYQLIETSSGENLWMENLISYHHLDGTDVYWAHDRIAQVLEGAVRQNLRQLITRLNANLST